MTKAWLKKTKIFMESCYSTTNQSVTTPSPLPYEILSFFVIIRLGNITLQDGFYFSV